MEGGILGLGVLVTATAKSSSGWIASNGCAPTRGRCESFSGALAGLMTLLILHVLNQKNLPSEAGAAALAQLKIDADTPNRYLVYVACFVFGTQEKRFFNLLYEVAKLIVAVPDDDGAGGPRIDAIAPDSAEAGDIVVVRGHGFAKQAVATLGGFPLKKIQIADDGSAIAGETPAELKSADPVDIQVANPDGVSFVLKGKFKLKNPPA